MSLRVRAEGLVIDFATARGRVRALDGADLAFEGGVAVGLIGESGSGKTTLGMAIGRLLAANAEATEGRLLVDGRSVFDLDPPSIAALRRRDLGFVFQNPMTALNPTARIGRQLAWAAAGATAMAPHELLRAVGLPEPARVAAAFPHELSGGMAQRVVIAMAIARRPRLLVADEPTASLDASIRLQILDLLGEVRRETGAGLVLLSHELGLIARSCDVIGVMYGGRVVEFGPRDALLARPAHPYTLALLRAAPGAERHGERLEPIPGTPPVLHGPAAGCSFAPRCPRADALCHAARPPLRRAAGREVLCHHAVPA